VIDLFKCMSNHLFMSRWVILDQKMILSEIWLLKMKNSLRSNIIVLIRQATFSQEF